MDWAKVIAELKQCAETQGEYHDKHRSSVSESQREWASQAMTAALVFSGLAVAFEAGLKSHIKAEEKKTS